MFISLYAPAGNGTIFILYTTNIT